MACAQQRSEVPRATSGETQSYPPGRWRLAPPVDLARTVVWVSHILIRHDGSLPGLASFSVLPLPWTPSPPPPARSHDQALQLARSVFEQVSVAPSQFARLAQEYSEDVTTRDVGGSLGGIRAEMLYDWPEILDALAALRPGEVSRPVETAFGFHILQLREPPTSERVSGRRIVIGYDEAPWLHAQLAAKPVPARSRAAASVLAREIYEQVRRQPESFVRLLQQHSNHRDVLRDGDFGVWSTTEGTPFPRAIERLQSLAVGEVAPPLDTHYGFEIIQRTPLSERQIYAAARIQWYAEADAASGNTETEVARRMQRLAALLAQSPGRFENFQRESCCPNQVDAWEAGRGSATAEHALAQLRVGQIAAAPVKEAQGVYALFKRMEPRPWKSEPASLALPAPTRVDVVFVMLATDRLNLLRDAQREAERRLGLDAVGMARFREAADLELPWQHAESLDARRALLLQLQKNVSEFLGPERYARYWRAVEERVERELLRPGPGAFPW